MMGESLTGSPKKGRGSAPTGRKSHTQFGLKREKTEKGGCRPRGKIGMGKTVWFQYPSQAGVFLIIASWASVNQ